MYFALGAAIGLLVGIAIGAAVGRKLLWNRLLRTHAPKGPWWWD